MGLTGKFARAPGGYEGVVADVDEVRERFWGRKAVSTKVGE